MRLLALALSTLSLLSCNTNLEGSPSDSAAARAVVATVQQRISIARERGPVLVRQGRWLRPTFDDSALRSIPRPAYVALPAQANGSLQLRDLNTGVGVEATLNGALPVPAETSAGVVVYRGVYGTGSDLVQRATEEGTEDFFAFSRRPAEEQISYRVALGAGVAGLRFVSNTLEFLDEGGSPRLRVAPPYIVGADGRNQIADLSVTGCAVDRRPRAPWGEPVTSPGATSCEVRVAWSGRGVTYPAVLDPTWSTTGSTASAYHEHTATVLANGRVLVAGLVAVTGGPSVSRAELYDPAQGTWSVTGIPAVGRLAATASLLGNGKALLAGGSANNGTTASAELYDPVLGTWAGTGNMIGARAVHRAVTLPNGKVLVAGGSNDSGTVATTELYDPVLSTWSATGSLSAAREAHTLELLLNGKVLAVAGGTSRGYLASAELYDPVLGTWSATGSISVARTAHSSRVLANGKVLLSGGYGGDTVGALSSAQLYDPVLGTWSATGSLNVARQAHTSTVLVSGKVLVTGGFTGWPDSALASAELYDPVQGSWSSAGSLAQKRLSHSATLLATSKVLVAGGYDDTGRGMPLTSAELFDEAAGSVDGGTGRFADGGALDLTAAPVDLVVVPGDLAQPPVDFRSGPADLTAAPADLARPVDQRVALVDLRSAVDALAPPPATGCSLGRHSANDRLGVATLFSLVFAIGYRVRARLRRRS